jgi:hypothetical protein
MEIDNLQKKPMTNGKKMTCYACGKIGHVSKDCRSKNKVNRGTINNSERNVTCYSCGKPGHYSKECPNKNHRQMNSTEKHEDDPQGKQAGHESLSWTGCYDDSCVIHFIDKSGAGWFPQKPKNKRKVSIRNYPEVPIRNGPPKRYQSPAPGYVKIYEEVEKKEACATGHKQNGVFQSLVHVNYSPTMALIDTGASVSFISADLVQRLGIATQRKKHVYQLTAIDGAELPTVTYKTVPVKLHIDQLQQETRFDVLNNTRHEIVLGFPWLIMNKPSVNWQKRKLKFKNDKPAVTEDRCRTQALDTTTIKKIVRQLNNAAEAETGMTIPQEYQQ